MDDKIKEIQKHIGELKTIEYEKDKLNIFEYSVTTERPIFIEVGGPSAHIKIYLNTNEERDCIKDAVKTIISNREKEIKEFFDCTIKKG